MSQGWSIGEDAEDRDDRPFQKGVLRKLTREILGYHKILLGGVGLILVGTAATLMEPRLIGYAIDDAVVPKNWSHLQKIVALFFAVECVRVASTIAQAYLFSLLGQKVMHSLRMKLFAHLQSLSMATYDRNPAGRLVTRVTNDIAALGEMFSAGFVSVIGNVLIVAGILVWLMVLDWRLGLISASVLPALALASVYFSKRLRIAYRRARSRLSALNAFVAENILGMRVVHLFNRQKEHLERYRQINQSYADAQIGTVRTFAYFQPSITIASGLSTALVVWYGGGMSWDGTLKLGVLVAYFSYVSALFQPMREIADKWNLFLSGMASAERIFSILEWPTELDPEQVHLPAPAARRMQGRIVFENVWFAYEAEHWVLKDFSLTIEPGMKVGVVGHTGAGKTTLISLLLRFYEPQRGRILIDGVDLRQIDRRELRSIIGIVQQDVFLFSGSIADNIHLWNAPSPRAEQEVSQALRALGFEHWLEKDSTLGSGERKLALDERGGNLSMGERQVLAYVRALSADPSIWILDEATANVDSASELKLERSLSTASRGRTSILIAHRLATVRAADLILVLHQGTLVEKGSHRELMAQDGLYSRLYRYQASLEELKTEEDASGFLPAETPVSEKKPLAEITEMASTQPSLLGGK